MKEIKKFLKNPQHVPVLLVCVFVATFLIFFFLNKREARIEAKKDKAHYDAYISGVLKSDPAPLQESLLQDLQSGINDKYTKSDAYFVTHRFFDNNGDIYEIYDYVNAHPELAFLKEAEQIYPDIFQQIKDGTLPHEFRDRSYYAYMAYVEVLIKHGYSDIAAEGTLANQYAKLALFNTSIAHEMTPKAGAERAKNAPRDAAKAVEFLKLANQHVADILDGKITSQDVTPRDLLVGLNQYGSALRYIGILQGASSTDFSIKNSKEIFDFTMLYARKNAPELYLFTSLLNASTLAIMDEYNVNEVRAALYPWVELDLSKITYGKESVVYKVMQTRFEPKPATIGDSNLDIYSKRNTLRLAAQDPAFKSWLMKNGWSEADFK